MHVVTCHVQPSKHSIPVFMTIVSLLIRTTPYITEVRQLIFALANKVAGSNTELVAQAVGNALYGCQMMTSDHEEVSALRR